MHSLHTTISEVGQLRVGYTFRKGIDQQDEGAWSVVQLKDVSSAGVLDLSDLSRVAIATVDAQYLLAPGDLVIKSRGAAHPVAVVPDAVGPKTMLAAPLIVIRLISEEISPAYLAWFLNRPQSQERLTALATGSYIQTIGKSALEDIEILLPDRATQERIVTTHLLQKKEQAILERIGTLRRGLIGGQLEYALERNPASPEQGGRRGVITTPPTYSSEATPPMR
jgi:Type I restriction modification DNA specificity domain